MGGEDFKTLVSPESPPGDKISTLSQCSCPSQRRNTLELGLDFEPHSSPAPWFGASRQGPVLPHLRNLSERCLGLTCSAFLRDFLRVQDPCSVTFALQKVSGSRPSGSLAAALTWVVGVKKRKKAICRFFQRMITLTFLSTPLLRGLPPFKALW